MSCGCGKNKKYTLREKEEELLEEIPLIDKVKEVLDIINMGLESLEEVIDRYDNLEAKNMKGINFDEGLKKQALGSMDIILTGVDSLMNLLLYDKEKENIRIRF